MNKILGIFLLGLIPFLAYSQSQDAKLWTSIAIDKKINKKFSSAIEIEQRFKNNFSSFDKLLIEPTLAYKLSKRWELGLTYRLWYQKESNNNYLLHNRLSLGISYADKISDFKYKLTSKLQYGLPDGSESNFYASKRLVSRNSLKISYAIFGSRFTPYFKYELFTSLKKMDPLNYQWRLTGGTSFFINKKTDLRFYYMLEHEYNMLNREDSHVYGISLYYSL